MRERITFVHGSDDAFDPKQLDLQDNVLNVKSLRAAREDRLTLGLYDLPQELWRALRQSHELHIRWVSDWRTPSTAPFVSKISPGLHLFFTPHKNETADLLCPLLRKLFNGQLNCSTPKDSFVNLPVPSGRFASSSAYQYHESLSSLNNFVIYMKQKICANDEKCKARLESLRSVDHLDIDYDTISQSLSASAFWHAAPTLGTWNERIESRGRSAKTEVGVLANEKATQPELLSLGGFLTVLGKDKKLNPTLFSFPSRHHIFNPESTYSTTFIQPAGLHPIIRLTINSAMQAPTEECALHIYLTLPSSLFVDKYQLSSPNFLKSNNLRAIRALSGETDLEAPIWAVSKWGSALLLELAPPSESSGSWHADVPLHARYMPPVSDRNDKKRVTPVPWPIVFWACPADEGTKMNTNPFDRVNLGYDGLFGPRTMFYHVQPADQGRRMIEELKIPVMDLDQAGWIDSVTVLVVSLGFLWVCWELLRVAGSKIRLEAQDHAKKKD